MEDEQTISNLVVAVMLIGDVIALTLIFVVLMMVLHVLIKHRKPHWLYEKAQKTFLRKASNKSVSIQDEEAIYEEPSEVLSRIKPTPDYLKQNSNDEEFYVWQISINYLMCNNTIFL